MRISIGGASMDFIIYKLNRRLFPIDHFCLAKI